MLLGMNETSVLAMNEWIVYSFFFQHWIIKKLFWQFFVKKIRQIELIS